MERSFSRARREVELPLPEVMPDLSQMLLELDKSGRRFAPEVAIRTVGSVL